MLKKKIIGVLSALGLSSALTFGVFASSYSSEIFVGCENSHDGALKEYTSSNLKIVLSDVYTWHGDYTVYSANFDVGFHRKDWLFFNVTTAQWNGCVFKDGYIHTLTSYNEGSGTRKRATHWKSNNNGMRADVELSDF